MRETVSSNNNLLNFTAEATLFIEDTLDSMFLVDLEQHFCGVTPEGVELYHLDNACMQSFFGNDCQSFAASPQAIELGRNSMFALNAWRNHMTACVLTIMDKNWLMLRHYDEDSRVMRQFDKLIPDSISAELIDKAKMMKSHYRLSALAEVLPLQSSIK